MWTRNLWQIKEVRWAVIAIVSLGLLSRFEGGVVMSIAILLQWDPMMKSVRAKAGAAEINRISQESFVMAHVIAYSILGVFVLIALIAYRYWKRRQWLRDISVQTFEDRMGGNLF